MQSESNIPPSRDALWSLLSSDLQQVESGLSLLATDVGCGERVVADAFARDALGRLVCLFVGEFESGLCGRLVELRAWVERNTKLVCETFGLGPTSDQGSLRCLLLSAQFPASVLDQLRDMALPEVEAFEIDALRVGDRVRIGLRRVLGEDPPWSVLPDGPGGEEREHAREFLKILRSVAPEQWLSGDRYRRSVHTEDGLLGELLVRGKAFFGRSPGGSEWVLDSGPSSAEVLDAILRQHLETDQREQTTVEPVAAQSAVGMPAIRVAPQPGLASVFSMAEVSQEEFDVISELDREEPGSQVES